MTRHVWLVLATCCALVFCAERGQAHPIDSAWINLSETQPGRFSVQFRVGSWVLERDVTEPVQFPAHCTDEGSGVDCGSRGLSGTLSFPWLAGTRTQIMLDIEWLDGSKMVRIVTEDDPSVEVYRVDSSFPGTMTVIGDYVQLGVEHIVFGWDHLLFVLALYLLVRGRRRLFLTMTSFTLAHSLTLVSSALGLVRVAVAPVEALIALSILLCCAECLRHRPTFTRRAPWLVAFAFGLLHGFGFATALTDVGTPPQHLASALVGFNCGVELGQLLILSAALLASLALDRLRLRTPMAQTALAYVMGTLAAYWSIDRVWVLFTG